MLLLEDSSADAARFERLLSEALPDPEIVHAGLLQDAVQLLRLQRFDIVLTDLCLPDALGLDAPRQLRDASPRRAPVVVLSGRDEEIDVHGALLEGVQDYLIKTDVTAAVLARSVRYALSRFQAEEEARSSRNWAQGVLDAIEAATCAIDERGVIVATNAAWEQFARQNGGDPAACGVGADYLRVCDASDEPAAQGLATGLRTMLTTGAGRLELEYPCHGPNVDRWFIVRATPMVGGGAAVLTHVDVTELRHAHLQVEFTATHDPLTGLANRRLLMRTLQERLAAARPGTRVALVFLDLDRFKMLNDGLGHSAGDALLVRVAAELTGAVREGDLVVRHGGDEFIVVATVSSDAEASTLAQRLQAAVNRPLHIDDADVEVTASFGLAVAAAGDDSAEDLLRAADEAMHAAKETGHSSLAVFSRELQQRARARVQLYRQLRTAVKRDQFVLHYQPIVDSRRGGVYAVEALLRWEHPDRGLLSPADFLDVAESSGLIVRIGQLVVETACAAGRRWHDAGHALKVSINLSARQLSSPAAVGVIADALERTGFPAGSLIVEVTETAVLEDDETTRAALDGLKALGVHLAIDDFGTGYSTLAYVQRYPVDGLKIDRSFVRDVESSSDDRAIVASLVRLGRDLGLSVIAEGVETAQQLAVLHDLGCDLIQGYLFSRPVPARAVDGVVRTLAKSAHPADGAGGGLELPKARHAGASRSGAQRRGEEDLSRGVLQRLDDLRDQGLSPHTMAAALNAEGLRAPTGLRWHARSIARVLHSSA